MNDDDLERGPEGGSKKTKQKKGGEKKTKTENTGGETKQKRITM